MLQSKSQVAHSDLPAVTVILISLQSGYLVAHSDLYSLMSQWCLSLSSVWIPGSSLWSVVWCHSDAYLSSVWIPGSSLWSVAWCHSDAYISPTVWILGSSLWSAVWCHSDASVWIPVSHSDLSYIAEHCCRKKYEEMAAFRFLWLQQLNITLKGRVIFLWGPPKWCVHGNGFWESQTNSNTSFTWEYSFYHLCLEKAL